MLSNRGSTNPLKNLVSAVMSSNSACFLRLSLGVVFYHLNLSLFIDALLTNIPTGPLFSTTGLEASSCLRSTCCGSGSVGPTIALSRIVPATRQISSKTRTEHARMAHLGHATSLELRHGEVRTIHLPRASEVRSELHTSGGRNEED